MDIIRWENPPRDARDDARDLVLKLHGRSGSWALVSEQLPMSSAEDLTELLEAVGDGLVETHISGRMHGPRNVYARVVLRKR